MSDSLLLVVGIGTILLMAVVIAAIAGWEPAKVQSPDTEMGVAAVTGFVLGGLLGGLLWVFTGQVGWTILAFVGLIVGFMYVRIAHANDHHY